MSSVEAAKLGSETTGTATYVVRPPLPSEDAEPTVMSPFAQAPRTDRRKAESIHQLRKSVRSLVNPDVPKLPESDTEAEGTEEKSTVEAVVSTPRGDQEPEKDSTEQSQPERSEGSDTEQTEPPIPIPITTSQDPAQGEGELFCLCCLSLFAGLNRFRHPSSHLTHYSHPTSSRKPLTMTQ